MKLRRKVDSVVPIATCCGILSIEDPLKYWLAEFAVKYFFTEKNQPEKIRISE